MEVKRCLELVELDKREAGCYNVRKPDDKSSSRTRWKEATEAKKADGFGIHAEECSESKSVVDEY
jgi:hypothetical protein